MERCMAYLECAERAAQRGYMDLATDIVRRVYLSNDWKP